MSTTPRLATVVLGVAVAARAADAPWQSMGFVTLGPALLGVALAVRAPRHHGEPGNPWVARQTALFEILAAKAGHGRP